MKKKIFFFLLSLPSHHFLLYFASSLSSRPKLSRRLVRMPAIVSSLAYILTWVPWGTRNPVWINHHRHHYILILIYFEFFVEVVCCYFNHFERIQNGYPPSLRRREEEGVEWVAVKRHITSKRRVEIKRGIKQNGDCKYEREWQGGVMGEEKETSHFLIFGINWINQNTLKWLFRQNNDWALLSKIGVGCKTTPFCE